jgi:hypothetical protein
MNEGLFVTNRDTLGTDQSRSFYTSNDTLDLESDGDIHHIGSPHYHWELSLKDVDVSMDNSE